MSRFCTNCGQPVEDKMNNCPNCGYKLKNNNINNNNSNKNNQNVSNGGYKSRACAGVLAILLGGLGVHNFYLGYTGKAVAQLLLTILSCGFLGAVSSVWSFVEGILILTGNINTDGLGRPLGQ